MRPRTKLTLPLLVMATLVGAGCESESPSSEPPPVPAPIAAPPDVEWTPGPPRLTFDRTEHDFGRVLDIEQRTTRLTFHNTGGEDLVIDTIEQTRDCRAARSEVEAFAPGQGGFVDVRLSPRALSSGVLIRTLTVISNAVGGPQMLTFTADVQGYLRISPRKLHLQTRELGREHRATFTITSPDPHLEIDETGSSSRFVSCRRLDGPARTDRDADSPLSETFEVAISPDAPWGWFDEEAEVRMTAGDWVPGKVYEYGYGSFRVSAGSSSRGRVVARVAIQARLFGAVTAEPALIHVDTPVATASEYRVRLNGPAAHPLAVEVRHAWAEVLTGARARVRARIEPLPSGGCQLVLSVWSPRRGKVRGAVVIETGVPGEEQLVIPIAGVVQPAGAP
ncbi:MAG: DUF1573 domain-containing protein [Planctomycetes bacterium]|nr:DUF1573 domain-containing protein [Planctomycetota bacterium]